MGMLEQLKAQGNHWRVGTHGVTVRIDWDLGWVLETHCECDEWAKHNEALWENSMDPGISHIHHSAACEHVAAVVRDTGILEEAHSASLLFLRSNQPVAIAAG